MLHKGQVLARLALGDIRATRAMIVAILGRSSRDTVLIRAPLNLKFHFLSYKADDISALITGTTVVKGFTLLFAEFLSYNEIF